MDWLVALSSALSIYFAIGFAFSLLFVTVGLGHVDPDAKGASVRVRLLFLPAAIALWPLLIFLWLSRTISGKGAGP